MEQELGNGWTEGVYPEDYDRCLESMSRPSRRANHSRWSTVCGAMTASIAGYWIMVFPRFSPGGDFLGYIGSCIDIHERKEIEEALRASELRFRTMISAIPSLTYEGDPTVITPLSATGGAPTRE